MRNVYKNTRKRWAEDTKQNALKKISFTKRNDIKRYRIHCHYIEEIHSPYEPNVQNALL